MVHSWVTVSDVPVSSISKVKASIKSVGITQGSRTSKRNWQLARGLFFLFAFVILFSGFSFMHTSASTDQVSSASIGELVISVDSGDTLWELARTYKKDSLDTRKAVHYLLKRNGLSSPELRVGQTLIIPSHIVQ